MQLREDHAARRGSDRPWLHGQAHAGEPALRPRPRPLQGGARRRLADHGCLHPGSAAVSGSRGEFAASPAYLRQHPRDRRLVEGCCRGGTKSRGADCRSRRRDAADLAGDAREQRRCADLWPRRDCHRGGAASRRSFGHHRAADQARRRAATPDERISRSQGHDPQCARTSRAVRACDRRLRAALPLLARKTRVRAFAQRRHLDLRSDPRSLGRHAAVSRA